MRWQKQRDAFALEALEARVLLSGDGIPIDAPTPSSDFLQPSTNQQADVLVLDSAAAGESTFDFVNELFEGMASEILSHPEHDLFEEQRLASGSPDPSNVADSSAASVDSIHPSVAEIQEDIQTPSEDASVSMVRALSTQLEVERPVIFIPGFGGSLANISGADPEAALTEWILNRGFSPDKLSLEPLSNTYSNIVQSLDNIGYTPGADFFVANWDWRVPVALNDGSSDGVIEVSENFSDSQYESGLDYLGYWLQKAVTVWKGNHNGAAPDSVDIVTHSTGGLIARGYIQSDLYDSSDSLPAVNRLIQTGVPNQGAATTFNFLQNDFSNDPASRAGARLLDIAYNKLTIDGLDIHNPDGTIINHLSPPTKQQFISQYIETFRELLPSYDEFVNLNGTFEALTSVLSSGLPSGSIQNDLLFDLNFSDQSGGVNGFINRVVEKVTIVYSSDVNTADQVTKKNLFDPSAGIENEILPFDQLIGNLPTGEWFLQTPSNASNGDGTVPIQSSWGTFENETIPSILAKLEEVQVTSSLGLVDHTSLVNNVDSQRQIINALTGSLPDEADISVDLQLSTVQTGLKLIELGVVSPIEFAEEAYDRINEAVSNGLDQQKIDLVVAYATQKIQDVLGENATLTFADGTVELSADLTLTLENFVHVSGRLTFTKDLTEHTVDIVTGLTSVQGVAAGLSTITSTDSSNGLLARSSDYSKLFNLPVSAFQVAATDVNVFVGYDSDLDPGADGILTRNELSASATGLWAENIDIGSVFMLAESTGLPTIDALGLSFFSLNATADSVEIVGVSGFDLRTESLQIRVNSGRHWLTAPLANAPAVDFLASFGAGYSVNTGTWESSLAHFRWAHRGCFRGSSALAGQ